MTPLRRRCPCIDADCSLSVAQRNGETGWRRHDSARLPPHAIAKSKAVRSHDVTPAGKLVARAGESTIVPSGPTMKLTIVGAELRRALVTHPSRRVSTLDDR